MVAVAAPLLLAPLLLTPLVAQVADDSIPCTRTPQPCPNHPGRTFCASDPSPGQCDRPSAKTCPPCPPPVPPKPPPPGVTFPLPGNKDATGGECQSWWCPMLLETKHSTLLYGCCKPADKKGTITSQVVRSTDNGQSWTQPTVTADTGQGVYAATIDTIIMIVGWPLANASSTSLMATRRSTTTKQQLEDGNGCAYYLEKYCKADAGKHSMCTTCLAAPDHAVLKRGLCTATEVSAFCTNGTLPPAPPPVPRGLAWASQLPPLSPHELAGCSAGVIKSTDDGHTWSKPKILMVNGSLGPHYGGNGLNHGIQIHNGPHKGRLALAERLDCPGVDETPAYWRSYVLYSDDEGETWTTGQLLPMGWTECQIAEMKNGSLLMTSRLQAQTPNKYRPYPNNSTGPLDKMNKRRAFARSDDGGHTWAEQWYLTDRQPEIHQFESECAQGLTSSPSGSMYWAHPGGGADGHDRTNGTLQGSANGGGEWEFIAHIGDAKMGYGYSDAHVLRDGSVAVAFQRTFDPPVKSIEGGGYDIGLAIIKP